MPGVHPETSRAAESLIAQLLMPKPMLKPHTTECAYNMGATAAGNAPRIKITESPAESANSNAEIEINQTEHFPAPKFLSLESATHAATASAADITTPNQNE